jgi:hypothetical protein
MRKNKYYENLVERVVVRSESDRWEEAREEWQVLRYLFTIRNGYNNNEIFPIGSQCIKKFGIKDMSRMVKTLTEERSLYEAIRDNSPHFKDKLSRNLIIFLY